MTYNPGDFFLEDGKGLVSSIIRLGEKIYQHDSFCWATHAGLIVSSAGDTVEAEGNGVIRSSIETHIKSGMRFQVVDSGLDPRGRELAVEVAERWVGVTYGYVTILSIGIDMLSPDFFWRIRSPHSLICSELVMRALYHGGAESPRIDFGMVKPSDLARQWQVPPPKETS